MGKWQPIETAPEAEPPEKLPDEWSLDFSGGYTTEVAARKIVDEEFPDASEEAKARAASRIDALASVWGSFASSVALESSER